MSDGNLGRAAVAGGRIPDGGVAQQWLCASTTAMLAGMRRNEQKRYP